MTLRPFAGLRPVLLARTIWLVLLSVLSACSARDVATGREALAKCTLSSDCKDGLSCALGSCRTPCKESRDCGNGGACVSDGVTAACQSAMEKETACEKTRDCPVPLACAGDYRCRNLCDADEDCNVLGISGRVCASDSHQRSYCAEPKEVEDGVITVEPPSGATISMPNNAEADPGRDASTSTDAQGRADASAGVDGGGGARVDAGMPASAEASVPPMDAASDASTAGDGDAAMSGDSGPKTCSPTCGLGFQCVEGACSACGAENQACCGTLCNTALSCTNGTCGCGAPGEKCCGGTTCDNAVLCKDGTCTCGGAGQSCCPQAAANACGSALACAGKSCACIANVSYDLVQKQDNTLWTYPPAASGPPVAITLSSGAPLKVKSFGQGNGFNCAVALDGTPWCWNTQGGSNSSGQLGNSTVTPSTVPVQVVTNALGTALLSNIDSIAVGASTACAVSNTGAVWCWGNGGYNLLGNGAGNNSAFAIPVLTGLGGAQFTGVAKVSVSSSHACALKAAPDRGVWCWGLNNYGQTGVTLTTTNPAYPTNVANLQDRTTDLVTGSSGTCAVLSDGLVYCFGAAAVLGQNSATNSAVPLPVLLHGQAGGELKSASKLFGNWSSQMCALIDPAGTRALYCWSGQGYALPLSIGGFPVQAAYLVGIMSQSYTTYVDANGVFYRQGSPANPPIACP